jgi:PAS domain S-box-containing protein
VVARTGQPIWGEELDERFADGTRRWLYGNVVPLLNEDGTVRGVIATFVDITERKHAEEARAKLAAIVESSDDAIISKTLEGTVMSWNASAERIFGYRADEMIGQPDKIIIPRERHDEDDSILARLRTGELVDHYETVRLAKDGRRIDVSVTVSPVRDASGNVTGISKIVRDISQRKKTEAALNEAREALKRHAADLELMVAERTQELRETIAEVESFSYSISHDMRGPLRAIQGYASVLEHELSGKIGVEESEYLRRIAAAAGKLTNLVQDILSYSQISRGRVELSPIDLQPLLLEVIQQNSQLQAPRAAIHIEGPLPMVLGHEAALVQICANLLGNAAKFVSPGDTPRIRVWAEPAPVHVRIWVADQGIGIDPKNHERIFQMFERVNSPKDYDGTGIGLAIVKKAIERMGGRIGVQSELGKGARFWFELNRVD